MGPWRMWGSRIWRTPIRAVTSCSRRSRSASRRDSTWAWSGRTGSARARSSRSSSASCRRTRASTRSVGCSAYMPQDVGVSDGDRTVRALLLSLAPRAVRQAGESMLALEAQLEAGDPSAGMRLGEAIADWSALGGYELEGQWDASCRRIVARARLPRSPTGPARTLSGGERKQLVLDVLFASDADVLLLDEPDNFLDVPAKLALEHRIRASKKTIVMISHDREVLVGRGRVDRDPRGQRRVGPRRLIRHLSPGARGAPAAARRRRQALERGGAAAVPADEDVQGARSLLARLGQAGRRVETRWRRFRAGGPPPAPVADQAIAVRMRGGDSARGCSTCARSASPGWCRRSRRRSTSASASASSARTGRARAS